MTIRECLKKIVYNEIDGFNVKEDHGNVDKIIQVLNDNVNEDFNSELFQYIERLKHFNFFSELYLSNNFENSMVLIGGHLFHPFEYSETLKHLNVTASVINLTRKRYIVVSDKKEKAKPKLTDEELALEAKNALQIGFARGDNISSVKKDLKLPNKGLHGSEIIWTTSNNDIVNNLGYINRKEVNEVVTLTATIKIGAVTKTKEFVLTVKLRQPKIKRKSNISIFRILDKLVFITVFYLFITTTLDNFPLDAPKKTILGLFFFFTHAARSLSFIKNRRSKLIWPTIFLIVGIILNTALSTFTSRGLDEIWIMIAHLLYLVLLFGLVDRIRIDYGKYQILSSIMYIISFIFLIITFAEDFESGNIVVNYLIVSIFVYLISLIAPEEYFFESDSVKYIFNVIFIGLFIIFLATAIIVTLEWSLIIALVVAIITIIISGFLIYDEVSY